MVSIPDEVKALFSSDTVHKNFHVTFPNGETSDLNNEDVLSESVKFTESLCSQQYFKFGLAEASQIEFTAVGIPNVRGAYIECGIEIDCTRLGDAWAAAHPVDNSLSFLTPQTCLMAGSNVQTVSGSVAEFYDGDNVPAIALTAQITPVQNLNGYANPWAGGTGKNLFDLSTTVVGFITGSGGIAAPGAVTKEITSDYISITGGQSYTFSNTLNNTTDGKWIGIGFWDSGKTFISRPSSNFSASETNPVLTATAPANAAYARVSFRTYGVSTSEQFEAGSSATTWEPYSNVCPITGYTGVNVWVQPTYDISAQATVNIDWSGDAGTVYGGEFDVINGKLKARPQYASYNGEALVGPWLSSLDAYAQGTTPTTGAQVVDLGGTVTTYQLSANTVQILAGENHIWADTGDVSVTYGNATLYYRVPYGRFKIDTCPRNHGAMWQRQITAYSDTLTGSSVPNAFEEEKQNTLIPFDNVYNPKLDLLLYAYINSKDLLDADGFTYATASSSTSNSFSVTFDIYYSGANTPTTLTYSFSTTQWTVPLDANDDRLDFLLYVESIRDYAAEEKEIKDYILSLNIDWDQTLQGTDFTTAQAFVDHYIGKTISPRISYRYTPFMTAVQINTIEANKLIYPFIGSEKGKYEINHVAFAATSKSISGDDENGNLFSETFTATGTQTLYRYSRGSSTVLSTLGLSFKSTLKQTDTVKKLRMYSFANSFSVYDFMVGSFELMGVFFKPERTGELSMFQMSLSPTPITVSASDWESFWWDETPIEAIGTVKVVYTDDKSEEQQQTFTIGTGNSVYTIENNAALTAANMDETAMGNILTTYFAPNASVVNFTPVDMTMRGLPYLESGDYIEMTAEDGTTVDTYILSQTISGIQHLRADIASTNGNLLEVIES